MLDEQLGYGVLADRIMEPLFESKPESYVAEELAKRLNVDPAAVNTMSDAERTYTSLAGAMYMTDHDTMQYAPLLTITQEDIESSELRRPARRCHNGGRIQGKGPLQDKTNPSATS